MAFCTRAAVPGSTFSELLMVRETVAVETFALLATSRMFMQVREKNPRSVLYFSKRWLTGETRRCNVHAYMPAIRGLIALRKPRKGLRVAVGENFRESIPNQKWSTHPAGRNRRPSWRKSWLSYFAIAPTAATIPAPSRMVRIWLAFTCVNRSSLPVVGHFTSTRSII